MLSRPAEQVKPPAEPQTERNVDRSWEGKARAERGASSYLSKRRDGR